MNTKTAKSEALSLLALDELTRGQEIELNTLTAKQAGYRPVEDGTVWNLSGNAWKVYYLVDPNGERVTPAYEEKHYKLDDEYEEVWLMESPDFCTSVDACLTLPLPSRHFWDLGTATQDVQGAYPSAEIMDAAHFEHGNHQYAATLPLAMLRAWWQIQPE